MKTRILTGLALGAFSLAALGTAASAGDSRNVATQAIAAERTGSIVVPHAYTAGRSAAAVAEQAAGAYENTLHLFGARTDNAPF
ncbi:hypothetical protein [Methylobacterium symbioticum]|uniref:Uncharacterized protein n=1 Tax=Methylobacterium symbioticum TaxID=2584084 RepID=A0A509E675_9HYPH|nr:hypothetical protein [Methylobacterium symbioticum]VUD69776.1 hypothetical protein MET9862_00333 [Methylobacterium symbioticum]